MMAPARIAGAVLLLAGAIQLATGWAGTTPLIVLGTAVLLPYCLLLLGARLRLPAALAALAVLALLALAGAATDLFDAAALRDAIPRLLTAPRPAPPTAALLLPGVLLAAVVGLFAGIRATRTQAGFFAPVAGAAVLYVGGALLSAGQSDRHGVVAALLVVSAAAGWAMLERPAQRRAAALSRALPGLAVGVAVTALVAATLPAGGEFEPRRLISPPPLPLVERNPLPRLAAFATQQADQEMFRHTVGEHRLHLVALAEFDGAGWEAGARYRPVGAVAQSGLPAAQARNGFTADITIGALSGPWLPAPGMPNAVTVPDARVDADSGSLVVASGLRTGLRYRVRGTVDTPIDAELASAAAPLAPAYLGIPRLPYLFSEYVQRIVRGARTPFEQAVLIESAVREARRLDTNAPAGSSYARLEMFLFGKAGQFGAQAGTSEQFATAFAVLARRIGLPTRVVVGFRPGQRGTDGTWVVRGRDALAWPEVYFTGQGWVPFDPTPSPQNNAGIGDDARRLVLDLVGQNPPSPRPRPTAAKPKPTATASAPPAATGTARDGGGSTVALVGRVGGLAALLAPAVLALARILRRWRHRRSGPPGAWSEVLDLLVLLGRRPPRWRDARWIAEDLATAVSVEGPHPAVRLAAYADRAAFAPAGSSVDTPWPELRRLRRAVRRSVSWRRRLAWPVDPRPLLRR